MPDLDITASDRQRYDVTVTADDGTATRHCVSVPDGFLAELGLSDAQEPVLVRASLVCLLEREPASTIPAELTLADVAAVLPDYRTDVMARL